MSVISKHNAGFFSCCSVKLQNIVDYINLNSKMPIKVDSSQQFEWYKSDKTTDITYEYFEHYNNLEEKIYYPINYHEHHEVMNYSNIDYNVLPLVRKYFSPSKLINNIIKKIEDKYNLTYNNICVLFYRGNDKIREITLSKYDDYVSFANSIMKHNPNIVFLIQSDETEFIHFFIEKFPNSFYFKDEIRHMNKCDDTVDKVFKDKNYEFSKYYLAITIIMSKCKYIVCGSGNCSIWIMFYRGNNNNVCQFLNGTWINKLDIPII